MTSRHREQKMAAPSPPSAPRSAAAARAWSLAYAETSGKLMSISPAVPLTWLSRAKIRITPIDDDVVFDEQQTIDLYFRSGLIKQKLNAAGHRIPGTRPSWLRRPKGGQQSEGDHRTRFPRRRRRRSELRIRNA
jgi:hypothetical protein